MIHQSKLTSSCFITLRSSRTRFPIWGAFVANRSPHPAVGRRKERRLYLSLADARKLEAVALKRADIAAVRTLGARVYELREMTT